MKTKIISRKNIIGLLVICMAIQGKLFAQENKTEEYRPKFSFKNPTIVNEGYSALKPYLDGIGGSTLTSSATLNAFFATKISSYLSNVTDLSLSNGYAVLDNADGRLFLGGTLNAAKGPTDYTRFLFTLGIKANIANGFSNLFGKDGVSNDIGLSFKTTLFGRGIISYNEDPDKQKNVLRSKRKHLVNELLNDYDDELEKYRKNLTGIFDSAASVKTFSVKYTKDMKTKFVKKEADYIIEKELYNLAHTWWVSIDAYVPISKSQYNIVSNFSTSKSTLTSYRPYELNLIYSNFFDCIKGLNGTHLFTVKSTLLANNSVKAESIKEYTFYKYLSQSTVSDTLFLANLKSKKVYVGDYEHFLTPKLSVRYVYMPFKYIGVSMALEKSFGKIDDLNWRLGIPVSLKDKEGNSKINFEVAWHEISKVHAFGLSVGLPIGNTIF